MGIIKLKFDEREMVTQRIVLKDANDEYKADFYVCRFFGSRDCWIDIEVLSSQMQKFVSVTPLLLREVEVDDGQIIRVISIDWLLEHFKPDVRTREWFEGISTVFDRGDNSKGQLMGQLIHRNR